MHQEMKLLQSSLTGDQNAFAHLVEQYQSTVCAITFSGTGRVDISEDLAQETFLNAWKNLHQLKDLAGFRSWLCSIARNLVHNYYRHKKTVSRVDVGMTRADDAEAQNPSEILLRKEEQMLLENALMHLSEKYREPLVMYYRQQQSVTESAKMLGLSEATMRTRLHRARKMLREEIAGRLEHVLKQSGPGKAFTTTVMASIAGTALKSTVASAAVQTSGATGWSVPVALTGVTGKVALIAAGAILLTAGVIVYRVQTGPSKSIEPSQNVVAREETNALIGSQAKENALGDETNLSALMATTHQAVGPEGEITPTTDEPSENELARNMGDPSQASSADPNETPNEIPVTGRILDKNTLSPIQGAQIGFNHGKTVMANKMGQFTLSYTGSHDEATLKLMAPGYAFQTTHLRVNPEGNHGLLFKMEPGVILQGRVIDPNRNPIDSVDSAKVFVTGGSYGHLEGMTNEQGEFEVAGLNPKYTHSVHADHSDFTQISSSVLDPIRLGEKAYAEVILAPHPPGAVVFGQIFNARSEPVKGVMVSYRGSTLRTHTDERGRYRLEGLGRDSFDMMVAHPNYAPMAVEVALSLERGPTRLDLQLEAARKLSGRVINDRGEPVRDAHVWHHQYNGKRLGGMGGFRADARGYFVIPNVPARGEYSIGTLGKGIERAVHPIDLEKTECVLVAPRSGKVYGQVIDVDTGKPLPCFHVTAVDEMTGRSSYWEEAGFICTSQEGFFDTGWNHIPLDVPLSLTVSADGYDSLTLTSIRTQPISKHPDRIVFALTPSPIQSTLFVGRVVDGKGEPVHSAEVAYRLKHTTRNQRGFMRVLTDASGTYMLPAVNASTHIVYIRAHGYALQYHEMAKLLLDGGSVFMEVVLEPAATVSGHVWDENGTAIAHTKMMSWAVPRSEKEDDYDRLSDRLWPEVNTDEQGYYRLTDLPAGEIQIQPVSHTYRVTPKRVVLETGQSLVLNFGDGGGSVVSGVVQEGDAMLSGVEVQLKSVKDRESWWGRTDAAGYFKIIEVPEDKYLFALIRPREQGDELSTDPNDQSHLLYKLMHIQKDLQLRADYQTRTIEEISP